MDPNIMSQQQQQPQTQFNSFEMDDLSSQNLMSGGNDQRQISVNVDKNMFMVQSNLNGAQFNVQGSALPQGPNLRTNVAVNMQIQSNRYPPNGMSPGGAQMPPSQMGNAYKYGGPGFDPAGQGMPPPPMQNHPNMPPPPHMWPPQMDHPMNGSMHTAAPPTHFSRAPNFEMYSNLSEFKPISDTPKGTVEYLPGGKTREKSKDNPNDFPNCNNPQTASGGGGGGGDLGGQSIHMPNDMMPQGGPNVMMGGSGDITNGMAQQQSMMMTVSGPQPAASSSGPLFDPSNTFTDFPPF